MNGEKYKTCGYCGEISEDGEDTCTECSIANMSDEERRRLADAEDDE